MDPLLSVRETSRLLNISQSLLYRYVNEQAIACVRFGSRILFTAEQVEAFIERCSKAAQR